MHGSVILKTEVMLLVWAVVYPVYYSLYEAS